MKTMEIYLKGEELYQSTEDARAALDEGRGYLLGRDLLCADRRGGGQVFRRLSIAEQAAAAAARPQYRIVEVLSSGREIRLRLADGIFEAQPRRDNYWKGFGSLAAARSFALGRSPACRIA